MKVERFKVYRVVSFDLEVKVGDMVVPSEWEIETELKQEIEDALEVSRPISYPSRNKCLFVCFSKENAYEWAYIKYGKRNTPYIILTLELTGELYWFMSDYYNFLGDKFTQEQLDKACLDYWNSMTNNIDGLALDKGYEGLFIGEAKVIAVGFKNYINGESFDIL